ncbi:centromere protein M-like [Glandiceps talaboti]
MANVLKAYNKVPALNTATVLLVGVDGIGKHQLADAMLDLNTTFNLHVRTTTNLPLPEENAESRPKIDFVVFIIDMSKKNSFTMVESCVKLLDINYFLGRVCFVITHADKPNLQNVSLQAVIGLCDAYDSPMVWGSMETKEGCHCLARKLLTTTEIIAGCKTNVTPMLIRATRLSCAYNETL